MLERERHDGLEILTLNNPSKMNALDVGMREALGAAISNFVADETARCLIVTGSGPAFCAGGDLQGLSSGRKPEEVARRMQRVHSWVHKLITVEKPVIMAVNAVAAGAGFGLALMGDFVLASSDASFVPGFTTIGLAPDFGLGRSLPRAVGVIRAKDILLGNRRVSAHEGAEIGLVTRVLPSSELMAEAIALGISLAEAATGGLGIAKSLIDTSFDVSLERYLELETSAQVKALSSQDGAEGIGAFLEKREPRFVGR